MKVAIIKYNGGNTRSVFFALERIGVTSLITDNPEDIRSADKLILPGVGEAQSAMNYLKNKELDEVISSLKQPVLGICLGMQLMCGYSEEGNTQCLGIFDHSVKRFDVALKVPHTGWNTITDLHSPLFKNIKEEDYVYFVHSYYVDQNNDTIATANYQLSYSAAIQKNNFYGVQFHPEKSGRTGQQILENFIKI